MTVQNGWRWCNKCQGLFLTGNPNLGWCPAGGGHDYGAAGAIRFNMSDHEQTHALTAEVYADPEPARRPTGPLTTEAAENLPWGALLRRSPGRLLVQVMLEADGQAGVFGDLAHTEQDAGHEGDPVERVVADRQRLALRTEEDLLVGDQAA